MSQNIFIVSIGCHMQMKKQFLFNLSLTVSLFKQLVYICVSLTIVIN